MSVLTPPTYQLLVNGVDLTQYLEQTTWTITSPFTRQGGTAKFTLIDNRSENPVATQYTPTFVPQALQTISLKDTSINRVLFSGLTGIPHFQRAGPLMTRWVLDCRDWTFLADTAIVAGDFVGQSADAIAKTLIAQAACGIVPGTVQPAPTLNRLQVNFLQLSVALKTLARLASQSTDYGWYIDENLAVQFYSTAQAAGPVATLTDNVPGDFVAGMPDATHGGYAETGFDYLWDGYAVRSAAIVRGAKYPGVRTDTWRGDGVTTQWQLSFPLNTASSATLKLTVGGAKTALWLPNISGGTQPASGYQLIQSAAGPWVLQVYGGQRAPGRGVTLTLAYSYHAPVVARADASAFQAAHSGLPNRGVFQMFLSDPTLVTLTSAQGRAVAEVQQYGYIQERCTLTTTEGFSGHIRGGDQFTLKSLTVPDSKNSFSVPLSATMLALAVTISGSKGGWRKYAITSVRTA